jgi:hypothetical protein
MPITILQKSSWASFAALFLLLSCNQQSTVISPNSAITPQQGTTTQAEEDKAMRLHQAVLNQT